MAELRVVATAGHVDHGKSSLIVRLTGMDPDRWAEEKRRGLTIDLGYAWCTLSSGREIGFVDVPGHERFIANMLAGVGPVRLVLFVVAANEGWQRQSEEHLAILDVLGVDGGVVALTKRDLVDDETYGIAEDEVRERIAGTVLASAPIVGVSAATGGGIDELAAAIDDLIARTSPPEDTRARLFVDRVFTIGGAGTVVTGTLGGDRLAVGEEIEVYPRGRRARIRSLQTHRHDETHADPVARVAANLVGTTRDDVDRGDVLGPPGVWRPTTVFEASFRPIRELAHPITPRGAFTVHVGAAESDARLRILGGSRIEPGGDAFVRITTARPLVLDVSDRFVLRESGRRETVGGGTVLDPAPPRRAGPDPEARLARRAAAARDELPAILADERGAVRASDVLALTGSNAGHPDTGDWILRGGLFETARETVVGFLSDFHQAHPREAGAPLAEARAALAAALRPATGRPDRNLLDAVIDRLVREGHLARTSAGVRLASHTDAVDERDPTVRRLLAELDGAGATQPPTIPELVAGGVPRDVIEASVRSGLVVRVSPDLVFSPKVIERARGIVAEAGATGITVSAFREALGTSRRYALPLLEWFDQRGVTRRQGDLRFARS